MIDYKFREDVLIAEFKEYIDSTYNQHYSTNKFQSTEIIIDRGHGTGFCMGNVDKYSNRYGKKGTRADARKDLMKVLHYALIQLYIHDKEDQELEDALITAFESDMTIDLADGGYDYAVSQDFDVEPRDIATISIGDIRHED
jgi:hypothetical protein